MSAQKRKTVDKDSFLVLQMNTITKIASQKVGKKLNMCGGAHTTTQ